MYRQQTARFLTRRCVRYPLVVALTFLVVAFYATMALNLKFLNPIANVMKDFSMVDIYYQALWSTSQPDTSRVVTIVDLTDQYYRSDIAATIERIERHHPRVLGIDALFKGDRDDLEANFLLMDAIASHDNIVCSYVLRDYRDSANGYDTATVDRPFFTDMIESRQGFTNMPRQLYGGIKREVRLAERVGGQLQPSFALVVSNLFIGDDAAPLPLEERSLGINFSPKEFSVVTPADIDRHPELIEGRIVLFGATHDDNDMHYTPLGKMAGVKLLAYAVETLLLQNEVHDVSGAPYIVISFVLLLLIYIIETLYLKRTQRSQVPLVKHFLGSSYVAGLVVFAFSVVMMGACFIIFSTTNVSISLTLTLAGSAFLTASQSFYLAIVKTLDADATLDGPSPKTPPTTVTPQPQYHDTQLPTAHHPTTDHAPLDAGAAPDGVSHLG